MFSNLAKKLQIEENYISVMLGFLVLVIGSILVYNYIQRKSPALTENSQIQEQLEEEELPKSHKINKGESLWKISEIYYGTGYKWVELAKTNNLVSPDMLNEGDELTIPKLELNLADAGEVSSDQIVKPEKYSVEKGDSLWKIALKYYGDGYKWVDIANANTFPNPDIIIEGAEINLP